MAHQYLQTLPTELQLRIIEMIPNKKTLAALCQTCGVLRYVALPLLYREVEIQVEADWGCMARTRKILQFGNPGAKFMRWLQVDSPDYISYDWQLQPVLQAIFYLFPPDTLTHFSTTPTCFMSFETFLTLCNTQSRLRSIGVWEISEFPKTANEWDSETAEVPPLHDLQELEVNIQAEIAPDFCVLLSHLLGNAGNVQKLMIRTSTHGSRTFHEAFRKPSFDHPVRHLIRYDALQELTLVRIDLGFLGVISRTLVDFTNLKTLRIVECPETIPVLRAINANKDHGLVLAIESLELILSNTADLEQDSNIIEAFLNLCTRLRKLCLISDAQMRVPSVECLTQHAETLEVLLVHTCMEYGSSQLASLLCKCTKLRELGIELSQLPSDHQNGWDDPSSDSQWIFEYLSPLKQLHSLKTLMICESPSLFPDAPKAVEEQHDAFIRALATRIFTILPVSTLVLGNWWDESMYGRWASSRGRWNIYYKPSDIDPTSSAGPKAHSIRIHDIPHPFLRVYSEIVDFLNCVDNALE